MNSQQYFATCPKGLEGLLKTELENLGATDTRETVAGVYFEGDLKQAYRVCLWSRLANKVLLPLGRYDIKSGDDLYEAAISIKWQEHLKPGGTLLVDFTGTNDAIRNSQFGALKIKDAVVDCIRQHASLRPNIDKQDPDLRINARLSRDKLILSIDLCGDSLHRRGYRTSQGAAPLKENLAAAILYRAGWPEIAKQGGALIDPMCGSGTILIEAAFIAADRAPGLERKGFNLERWQQHDPVIWEELITEAKERYRAGIAAGLPEIRGYDEDPRVLRAADSNIAMAGMEEFVRVIKKPLRDFVKPTHTQLDNGLLITNPPYGERLGEVSELGDLYRLLGDKCRQELEGWKAAVFTGNPELGRQMGIRAKKRYKFFNGTLPSELLLIDVEESQFVNAAPESLDPTKAILKGGAEMLANRLKKNLKQMSKWVKREGIEAYRLYDADMPEYSAAIDIYGARDHMYVHVQEYQAPKTIDEEKAIERFKEIQRAVPVALGVQPENISYKQRRRTRGKSQYEKQSQGPATGRPVAKSSGAVAVSKEAPPTGSAWGKWHAEKVVEIDDGSFTVKEGQATFKINLWDYLDTGLFLDHRPTRLRIAQMARGKKFLNLFCYTATATVHAALGGAKETVSVDMSKTYIKWAEDNFKLNNMDLKRHRLEQADCFKWLNECREGFDLIMLDPPSFSNSKRMDGVLDIQRDHVQMIDRCMELLTPGGTLIFSNNLRSFKLDEEALAKYKVENITRQSLDVDFKRNTKIHQCWLIS